MNVDGATALIVAVTGLVAAVGAVIVQVRGLRRDLNGRVSQLIDVATTASHRKGELEGRDFMRRVLEGAPGSATDLKRVPPEQES